MNIRTMAFIVSLLLTVGCRADVLVGFPPEGSAQKLVMNTLNIACHSINLLVNAGIEVRTVDNYKIMHDKMDIVDGVTVQTGSYNYTRAAQRSNSENVVVMWQMPEVALVYLGHWQSRWSQGQVWQSRY